MNKLIQSPTFWSIIYCILVLSREPVKNLLKAIGKNADSLLTKSTQVGNTVQKTNNQVFKTLEHVLDLCVDALSNGISALQAQIIHVSHQLSKEKGNLASRILGSLINLTAMLIFLYADAALGFQAVQTLFPDITVPDIFRNIGIALVAASVGTIFALGMLFWDTLGLSDFTPLAKMKGFAKGVFIGFVVTNALATLICVFLIALNRASLVASLVNLASFSPAVQGEIHRLASMAHSLLVIPMLVTTFMMLRGIFGLLVIYTVLVGVISLLFQFVRLLLKILRRVVSGTGMSEVMATGLLLSITNLVLMGLGWIFGVVIASAAASTEILQKLLDVVTTPPVVIWDFVSPLIKKLLSRNFQPAPIQGKLSGEQLQHLIKLYQAISKPVAPVDQAGKSSSLEQNEEKPDLDGVLEKTSGDSDRNNHK
jgi:hypothetical protein